MPILSQIEFTNQVDSSQIRRMSMDDLTFEEIKHEIESDNYATIINTFIDEVSLEDIVESTKTSINLFNYVQDKIDILAVMQEGSGIKMRVQDITNTPTIVQFSTSKWRGTTVAVVHGKQTTKFFLNLANHFIKQAGFTTADTEELAIEYINKYRLHRV